MIIGITTTFVVEEQRNERVPVERVTSEYIKCIAATGATPVLLCPVEGGRKENERAARELIERIDGLILAGGGDIAPARYGDSKQLPETTNVFDTRDFLELELARAAHERNLATLGICRGMQVMNVALGGTLHQDVKSCGFTAINHQQQPPYDIAEQSVRLIAGSVLEQVLQTDSHPAQPSRTIGVNSMHHQAIARVAAPLHPSATSNDGLIEGLEDPTRRFFLGIQWHPEYLPDNEPLFHALAEAAAHTRT